MSTGPSPPRSRPACATARRSSATRSCAPSAPSSTRAGDDRADVLDALDAALSWATWEGLRAGLRSRPATAERVLRRLAAAVLAAEDRLYGSFGRPSRRSPMMFFCTWVVPPAIRPPGAPSSRAAAPPSSIECGAGQVGLEHGGVEHQLGDAELGQRSGHRGHRALPLSHGLQRPAPRDELDEPVSRDGIVGALRARPWRRAGEPRAMPAEPMWPRSLVSVAIATPHPPCSGPSRASAGSRTSSRNTSSNSLPPVIWRSGRTSMPGRVHVDQEERDAGVRACARDRCGPAGCPGRPPGRWSTTPSAR